MDARVRFVGLLLLPCLAMTCGACGADSSRPVAVDAGAITPEDVPPGDPDGSAIASATADAATTNALDAQTAQPDAQPPATDATTAVDSATPTLRGDADAATRSANDAFVAPPAPFEGEGQPWTAPAPRATCAPGDKADPTLSGLSGDVRCNLEVVGQVAAQHFASMAWYRDCAYVNGTDGTSVIRVAPDGTPRVTTTLTTVGFRNNWESMKVGATGLLAGYEANGSMLSVYDLTQDCAAPALQSTTSLSGWLLSGTLGHAGNFSPDGTIYYASSMYTGEVIAVDLTDAKKPKVITNKFERGAHDLYVAKGGTRGYFAMPDVVAGQGIGSLAIMDLSAVQARATDAKGTLIKELTWQDGNVSQYPTLLSFRGKDHLLITDELGSGNCNDAAKPQWGYARIFDLSDETAPKQVALIKTEAQDPKHCQAASMAPGAADLLGFGFGVHYCSVDRVEDPRLLACANWAAGLRLYDIRNPWRPRELAYFDTQDDSVPSLARIHVERRELWVATAPGTFYVLKFPQGGAVDQILSH